MLSSILSKSDCAACKFCCSFRRQSLWETPIFFEEDIAKIKELYPDVKFREIEDSNNDKLKTLAAKSKVYTFDIYDKYKTNDREEEAPCPFLDTQEGCKLPPELKPFDCKIWPLRVVKMPGSKISQSPELAIALTPTCPAINKVPFDKVQELAKNGLGKTILEYAESHPQMVKEYSDFLSKIVIKNCISCINESIFLQ